MIAGTTSTVPGVCKAVGMVDLRAVWPALKEHLDEIGYGAVPLVHREFTELGRAGKAEQYEKNWSPFFGGPSPDSFNPASNRPLFTTSIIPRRVVQFDGNLVTSQRTSHAYALGEEINLRNEAGEADSGCIIRSLPSDWDVRKLHLATPFHRVTMCNRGTCAPTEENTVLMGLIHFKVAKKQYRR